MTNESIVRGLIYFKCSEEVMEQRLLLRGKTSGRADDNIDTIKKRFKTFTEDTQPVVERYDKLGIVITIDA
jgi:UMP-CMP kinase